MSQANDKSSSDSKNDQKSSTNRSTSASTPNGVAMSSRAVASPTPKSGMKRFLFKIGEKLGTIEQTQYTPQFKEACEEVDNYKLALEDISTTLMAFVQRDTRYDTKPQERMNFVYPDNENPFEMMSAGLNNMIALLLTASPPTSQAEAAKKLGPVHRDYHRRCRRALKHIRYFLCVEFVELSEGRKLLSQTKHDMDFAKHELKNAKSTEVIDLKHTVYEATQKQFEGQLQKVLGMLDRLPHQKEQHLRDLKAFFTIFKVYHEEITHVLKVDEKE